MLYRNWHCGAICDVVACSLIIAHTCGFVHVQPILNHKAQQLVSLEEEGQDVKILFYLSAVFMGQMRTAGKLSMGDKVTLGCQLGFLYD